MSLKCIVGSSTLTLCELPYAVDLILEGPEDDSIGVETCCPKNSNIIIKFVVFD